jgi:ligand-binding sensor domain-containing protein
MTGSLLVVSQQYKQLFIFIVFFINLDAFSAYTPDSVQIKLYLSANVVTSTAVFGDTVWLGAFDGGIIKTSVLDSSSKTQLSTDNGLSGNCIYKLAVDNIGTLWAGTDSGVSRISPSGIDGFKNAGSVSMGIVSDLAVLGKRVVAVCNGTVAIFTGSRFELAQGLSQVKGRAAYVTFDDDTTLWMTGSAGILKSDKSGATVTAVSHPFNSDSIYDIASDMQRNIWFAMGDSIACYNGESWVFYSTVDGSLPHPVSLCIRNFTGGMSAAGPEGISSFENSAWKLVTTLKGYASTNDGYANIQDVAFYDTTKFVFGSRASMRLYDGKEFFVRNLTGLEDNSIIFCAIDTDDNLLVAPHMNRWGLHRFDGNEWTYYSKFVVPLLSNDPRCFAIDSNGGYWFGTDFGFSYMRNGTWKRYQQRDGLPAWRIEDCIIAPDSSLWSACYGGVMHYSNSTWRLYDTSDGLVSPQVRTLSVTKDGVIIAGGKGGVARMTDNRFITDRSPGAPSESEIIASLKITPSGCIVAAGTGCFIKTENGSWKHVLKSIFCNSLVVDSCNRIWVGTTANGLYVLDTNGTELLHLTSRDGLPSRNDISSIAQCRSGKVWLGTSNGLVSINVFWSAPTGTGKVKNSRPAVTISAQRQYGAWNLQGRTVTLDQKRQMAAYGIFIVNDKKCLSKRIYIRK